MAPLKLGDNEMTTLAKDDRTQPQRHEGLDVDQDGIEQAKIAEALHNYSHYRALGEARGRMARAAAGPVTMALVGSGTAYVAAVNTMFLVGHPFLPFTSELRLSLTFERGAGNMEFVATCGGVLAPFNIAGGSARLYYSPKDLKDLGNVRVSITQLGLGFGFGGAYISFWKTSGEWFGDAAAFGVVGVGGGAGLGTFTLL